jgi:hypothetical protein
VVDGRELADPEILTHSVSANRSASRQTAAVVVVVAFIPRANMTPPHFFWVAHRANLS